MKDTIIPILSTYIIGLIFLGIFLFLSYEKALSTHKDIVLNSVEQSLNNSIERYKNFAKSAYEAKFKNKKRIRKLLYKANKYKDLRGKIRKFIYEKYKSDYKLFKSIGVKQFQVHLRDKFISLIRFHNLDFWGDSLKGIRKTVELCFKTGKPVYGFEEGRFFSGYRNVFPINYKGETIASVEISIGLNAVAFEATLNKKKDFAKFILRRDLFGNKLISKRLEKFYKTSALCKNFVEDKSNMEIFWNNKDKTIKNYIYLENALGRDKNLEGKLHKFEKFSVLKFINGNPIVVNFIPFKDFSKQYAGYFVYFKDDKVWKYFISFVVSVGLILFFAYTIVFIFLVKQHLKLMILRSKDPLTGAWQKRCGLKLAESYIKNNNQTLSVIFIDIDNFKKINDTYGHKVGDMVLSAVSKAISDRIRETDIFLRYGGEELVIILPDTTLDNAFKVAEDIRKSISRLFIPPVGKVTISVGVAQKGKNDTLLDVINKADEAMYRAKKSGKNKVVKYYEES